MKTNRLALCLVFFWLAIAASGLDSFIRRYSHPGEYITRINAIKPATDDSVAVALEGYYPQTGSFFSRLQAVYYNGTLLDAYANPYVGDPLKLSSGLFDVYDTGLLITPEIIALPGNRFGFHWLFYYPQYSGYQDMPLYVLPDSIERIVEFPTALDAQYTEYLGSYRYLIGGRAIVNGIYRCFLLDTDNGREPLDYPRQVVYIPYLQHISALARTEEDKYLVVGQANGRTGTISVIDSDGNRLWVQNISDATDVTQYSMFNLPLLKDNVLSYQNRDRNLHIALYQSRSLQIIYTELLDGFIDSVPVCLNPQDSTVTFAYLKDGCQIMKQIDLQGREVWSRSLPGVGGFGRDCLNLIFDPDSDRQYYFMTGGVLPGGAYYLAKVCADDGSVQYDYNQPIESFTAKLHPNPFTDLLTIETDIPHTSRVSIEVYNTKGQKVKTILDDNLTEGKHFLSWNGKGTHSKSLPSGVYLIRIKQDGKQITRKVLHY